jgi:hypothetical protein
MEVDAEFEGRAAYQKRTEQRYLAGLSPVTPLTSCGMVSAGNAVDAFAEFNESVKSIFAI